MPEKIQAHIADVLAINFDFAALKLNDAVTSNEVLHEK
jgi:hypothetical protein